MNGLYNYIIIYVFDAFFFFKEQMYDLNEPEYAKALVV